MRNKLKAVVFSAAVLGVRERWYEGYAIGGSNTYLGTRYCS